MLKPFNEVYIIMNKFILKLEGGLKRKHQVFSLISFIILIAFAGCSGGGSSLSNEDSESNPVEEVAVLNYSFDSDFANNGIINVDLIPLDSAGNFTSIDSISAVASFDDGQPGVTARANVDINLTVQLNQYVQPTASSLPWAFAVDIDSSGSMSTSDPSDLRIDAAKLFVASILGEKPTSQFNIYDFGYSSNGTFSDTRQLTADWTSDQTTIDAAIDQVVASGGTPLYDSIYEILQKFTTEKDASSYQRAMLVLSDGSPNSYTYEQDVYDYSVANNIPINSVSLGSGSYEQNMKDLADETGGVYTKAVDAASLSTAFQNISLGTSNGYMDYNLVFPDPSVLPNGTSTTVNVTVTISAGGTTQTASFTLN